MGSGAQVGGIRKDIGEGGRDKNGEWRDNEAVIAGLAQQTGGEYV